MVAQGKSSTPTCGSVTRDGERDAVLLPSRYGFTQIFARNPRAVGVERVTTKGILVRDGNFGYHVQGETEFERMII